jgi:Vacuolar protein sorting-associated protein 62
VVLAGLGLLCAGAIVPGGRASAGAAEPDAAEVELAERYAPVVRLVEQPEVCGGGEPFEPIDVDLVLGNSEVVLRGPWDTTNVVTVAPTAAELGEAPPTYHLDFPGTPVRAGCAYEEFQNRIAAGSAPTTYARVVTEEGKPGKLAVQYWFFYVFNDFNNKHEGDWEMIQLVFDADDAAEALGEEPVEVGFSQHEGAERADWGAEKLELVDGVHPVVYPASGSHANYFDDALHLGRNAQQGVGCDDTGAPHREIEPVVTVVPSDPVAAVDEYPWLGYEGHWGEQRSSVFNGPTGPITKLQWDEPITWSEDEWRDSSNRIPVTLSLGSADTATFFCRAVAGGSMVFALGNTNLELALAAAAALVALLLWAASRTTWRPSAPLRLARRRGWGQIVTASGRMYRSHLRAFLGITAFLAPIPLIAFASSLMVNRASRAESFFEVLGSLLFLLGGVLTVVALAVVPVVVAIVMEDIDHERPVTVGSVLGATVPRLWPTAVTTVIVLVVGGVLTATLIGIPVAIWILVRWLLVNQVIAVERLDARPALRRSSGLIRGRWWTALTIALFSLVLPALLGPLTGALLILAFGIDFDLANLIGTFVFVIVLPFASAMRVYLFHDLLVRDAMRAETSRDRGVETLAAELDDDGLLVRAER